MPNITYKNPPGTGTLAEGQSPTGLDISENWYFPTATGEQSLEVINGHLDQNNLDASMKFTNDHFQTGTVSRGKMVGSTANIDYFDTMFSGTATRDAAGTYGESSDEALAESAIIIPGLAIKFYVPFSNSKCVLQWSFNHQNDALYLLNLVDDGVLNNQRNKFNFPSFFLYVDNEIQPENCRRYVPCYESKRAGAGSGNVGVHYNLGRHWSGHKLVTLQKGWHTASIRVTLPGVNATGINAWQDEVSNVPQCRVRTRGMRYILFR
tara:strand:- start:103 stop:897 length:795 start_codon:yes stop_codon:yes gene_type:complete